MFLTMAMPKQVSTWFPLSLGIYSCWSQFSRIWTEVLGPARVFERFHPSTTSVSVPTDINSSQLAMVRLCLYTITKMCHFISLICDVPRFPPPELSHLSTSPPVLPTTSNPLTNLIFNQDIDPNTANLLCLSRFLPRNSIALAAAL